MASSGDSNQRSAPVPAFNTLQFGAMSDSQLRQTISQLSHAASGAHYQGYAAPTPQRTSGAPSFMHFIHIVHHCAANSLPEKHHQLVDIFDAPATHGLTAQPRCEKQQSRACACDPFDARTRLHPTYPPTRVPASTANPRNPRAAPTTGRS